ncbi:MAG: GNAT family N-acetyltransferase [Candidatus Sericytochromatia bacterium]|nr:GNAT family N-acetyltransferase [Candidatus Sericytochromatia bacterium]
MTMHVDEVDEATWQAAWLACPAATFFHSPAWYRLACELEGGRATAHRFRFADGREAVLPMRLSRSFRGLVSRVECGVQNGYGGLLEARPLDGAQRRAIAAWLTSRWQDVVWTGNPHDPSEPFWGAGVAAQDETRVVDLQPFADQLAACHATRRRHWRRAEQDHLSVRLVDAPDGALLQAIYSLYRDHATRWQYTRWLREASYFRQLFAWGGPHVQLVVMYREAHLLGFQMVATGPAAALQLNLATDPEAAEAHAGTYLALETMRLLQARAVARVDLLPSGRLTTVRQYKESLGARPLPFLRERVMGPWASALRSLRRGA